MTVDRSRAVWFALVLIAIGAIAWLFLASPIFRISAIEVEGIARLTDDEVRELIGNIEGESLVFVSTAELVERLEHSPWIASAVVARSFPATLLVRIDERVPVAVAEEGAGSFLVSAEGVVLERADFTELPRIEEFDVPLVIGEELPARLGAVRVLAALPASVRSRVELAEEVAGEVTLRLGPGGVVRFGAPTDLRRRTQALEGVLEWAEERRVRFRYIDVRVPENPVLLPVHTGNVVEPALEAQG